MIGFYYFKSSYIITVIFNIDFDNKAWGIVYLQLNQLATV